MTYLHWLWESILAELAFLMNLTAQDNSFLTLIAVIVSHTIVCTFVAIICYKLLPKRYKQPRAAVILLMFTFAFIAPVIGALGILLITRISLLRSNQTAPSAIPTTIELPEYVGLTGDTFRSGQGAIRARLSAHVPSDIRMQALLTLQAVPGRVANPILESLLGDDTDDVRLLAFGMLDSAEKKVSAQIQQERARLEKEPDLEQRVDCLRHLAELHWEMIYASLAQGELRRHMLRQAHKYLDAALAIGIAPTPGMLFLKARLLLTQNDLDDAENMLRKALDIGLPQISALPYLGEIAFRRLEFDSVRSYMAKLSLLNIAPRSRAIADLWTGRDKMRNLSDFNHLPHL